jgi:hypothetical protein
MGKPERIIRERGETNRHLAFGFLMSLCIVVTVTHNNSTAEMLATIRRGPFAKPTDEEYIEYLIQRKPKTQKRPDFENYSLEHVLSFQRRVHAIKKNFMQRNAKTPLGRLIEWWDRTEAQMRAALHAHILCWYKLRDAKERDERLAREGKDPYLSLKPVTRTAPGTKPCQRPSSQRVEAVSPYQEDDIYHRAHVGRVNAEMVRPDVSGPSFGGYKYETLRIAGLARSVQSRLYLHPCTPKYCLQDFCLKISKL